MPRINTRYFGETQYEDEAVLHLPGGLPGFAECHDFLLLQHPDQFPLVYLQSLVEPGLCFAGLPVLSVDPGYKLWISEEDAKTLKTSCWPSIGDDVLCITLIASRPAGPSANLMAPVVMNLKTRTAVQCFNLQGEYSHEELLLPVQEAVHS